MMPYEKKSKAGLILGLAAAAEFILLIVFAIIVSNISGDALNKMPEMTARVEVVDKNIKGGTPTQYRICFQFKDGTEKIFITDFESYEKIQENQSGTLFYKEVYRSDGTNTNESDRLFIRFEQATPG